jgi:hypothetical protein
MEYVERKGCCVIDGVGREHQRTMAWLVVWVNREISMLVVGP